MCPSNYEGAHCEHLEPCSSSNCQAPLKCFGGACICPENENCAGACASSPCRNNGKCMANGADYICECTSGYNGMCFENQRIFGDEFLICFCILSGTNCELDIDECSVTQGICGHGICVNLNGTFKCYCEPGYTGLLCNADVDECLSHPCKNGAACDDMVSSW